MAGIFAPILRETFLGMKKQELQVFSQQISPFEHETYLEIVVMAAPTLRVARPSDDLDALLRFYRDGLGLELLGGFEGHDGFDGVMLGHPGAP